MCSRPRRQDNGSLALRGGGVTDQRSDQREHVASLDDVLGSAPCATYVRRKFVGIPRVDDHRNFAPGSVGGVLMQDSTDVGAAGAGHLRIEHHGIYMVV